MPASAQPSNRPSSSRRPGPRPHRSADRGVAPHRPVAAADAGDPRVLVVYDSILEADHAARVLAERGVDVEEIALVDAVSPPVAASRAVPAGARRPGPMVDAVEHLDELIAGQRASLSRQTSRPAERLMVVLRGAADGAERALEILADDAASNAARSGREEL